MLIKFLINNHLLSQYKGLVKQTQSIAESFNKGLLWSLKSD